MTISPPPFRRSSAGRSPVVETPDHRLRALLLLGLTLLSLDVALDGPASRLERARWHHPARTAGPWQAVSSLGEREALALATVLAHVLASRRKGRSDPASLTWLAAGVAGRAALARAVRRPRPPREWWLVEPEGFSFPSRHTTWSLLAYTAVARELTGTSVRLWRGPGLLAVGLVGLSRLRLGVHWPTDVVGGVLFGAILATRNPRRAQAAVLGPACSPGWRPPRRRPDGTVQR